MSDLEQIDSMNGQEFEHYCADLLRRNGYSNVHITPGSGDNGIDIFAEKDGVSYAIQCKRYHSKVGNKAVQEAFSGKSYYKKDRAIVLTNNYFTKSAIKTALKIDVILWDRKELTKLINNAFPKDNRPVHHKERKPNVSTKDIVYDTHKKQKTITSCLSWVIILFIIIWFLSFITGNTGSSNNKKSKITETSSIMTPTPTEEISIIQLYQTTSPVVITPTFTILETKKLLHLGIIQTSPQVGGTYIYQNPSSQSDILRWLYDGNEIEILDITADQLWYQVFCEQYNLGWILKESIFDFYQ